MRNFTSHFYGLRIENSNPKRQTKIVGVLLITLLSIFYHQSSFAQCLNSSQFGTVTAPTNSTPITITTCAFAGEYSTVNNCVAGNSYTFNATGGTGNFITIRQGTFNGAVLGFGNAPQTVVCTANGPLFLHYNTDALCGTDGSCHTGTVACNNCLVVPPPPNDLCAGALPITCGTVINGNTTTATVDAVPACVTTLNTAPGLWYKLDNAVGAVTLSLCGSAFDTKIGVFSGTCASLVCVTGNDDFCGNQSQVSFTAVSGTSYFVLVTGFSAGAGAFTLTPTCTQPPPDPCQAPIETIICAQSKTRTSSGTGVWSPNSCSFSTPGNEKVYSFTPISTGIHTLQVTAATGGFVNYFWKAASAGCGPAGWTCLKDISSPQSVTFGPLTAGVTYFILFDPEIMTTVTQTFLINCPPATPPNDMCANAIAVACGSTVTGNTNTATLDGPATSCPGTSVAPDVWYTITGTGTAITVSLCGSAYDTKIEIYTGACGSLICFANNDDFCSLQSQVTFNSVLGTVYRIRVHGFAGSTGAFTMTTTCVAGALTLTCPPATTVSCASAVPPPNPASATASSPCFGAITITHTGDVISAQSCTNRYTITRTYSASDLCGNVANCAQIITVNDILAPNVTCPAPVTVSCAALVPPVNLGSVTASDNCTGAVVITFVSDAITAQTCANRYTLTRTYRATDICGNSATCAQIITVNDLTPPTITCPLPVTVSCAALIPPPNIGSVTASDNCIGVAVVTFVSDAISGQTCANRYTLTRTYRATDICGNSAICAQIITVNDQTPPSLSCPANLSFECATAVPTPNPATVTSSDNCVGATTNSFVSDVITNQTCANKYTLTRTYRATDVCGNSATCAQTITVNDVTPPMLVGVPANITIECDQTVPNPPNVTGTDNCTGAVTVTFKQTSTKSNFTNQCKAYSYTITRTWTGTDVCGNQTNRTQIIQVRDTKPPVWLSTPPAFITVQCDEDDVNNEDPIAEDACDGNPSVLLKIEYLGIPGGCASSYNVRYTWTAGDKCGNIIKFVQIITVVDTEAPIIKCPNNIVVTSNVPLPIIWSLPSASDFCDGQIIPVQKSGPPNGSIFQPGTVTLISYSATDQCGNVVTCAFTVTVLDANPGKLNLIDNTAVDNQILQNEDNDAVSENGITLYQNEPNPFATNTFIRFDLDRTQNAMLCIFDVNGRMVKCFENTFNMGENKVEVTQGDLPSAGVYFYQLKTAENNSTKRMIMIR